MARRKCTRKTENVLRCRRCRDLRQEGERFFYGLCDSCRAERATLDGPPPELACSRRRRTAVPSTGTARRSTSLSCHRSGGPASDCAESSTASVASGWVGFTRE